VVGSDHAGYRLKELIKRRLQEAGHEVIDVGTHSEEPCDYPDYAAAAVREFFERNARFGILVCATGVGMSIVANKFRGIRAALAYNVHVARLSREHNHANFLCIGARMIPEEEALRMVDAWLGAREEGGRHEKRVRKISLIEEEVYGGGS